MSAPEMKALSPAPVTTTTCTSPSRANASRRSVAAIHMSSDTALRRSGLLKMRVPTAPSLRARILSVSVMCLALCIATFAGRALLERIRLAQRGDLGRLEAEFLEDRIGVLAEIGRRRRELAGRARQRHRLARHAQRLVLLAHALRQAEMDHLRIGVDLVDGVDRSARDAGLVEALDPVGAGALDRVLVDLGVERV